MNREIYIYTGTHAWKCPIYTWIFLLVYGYLESFWISRILLDSRYPNQHRYLQHSDPDSDLVWSLSGKIESRAWTALCYVRLDLASWIWARVSSRVYDRGKTACACACACVRARVGCVCVHSFHFKLEQNLICSMRLKIWFKSEQILSIIESRISCKICSGCSIIFV